MPKERRKDRVPFGVPRMKLSPLSDLPKNRWHRWINDEDNRIVEAQEGGFSFVDASNMPLEDGDDSMGKALKKRVGTHPDGSPKWAYLMSEPMEYYEEDKARIHAEIDEKERHILEGPPKDLRETAGKNAYVDPQNRLTSEKLRNVVKT